MNASPKILLVVALLCGATACNNRPVPAPRAQTASQLKNVYYTMRLIESDNRKGIVELLQVETNETTLRDKWIRLMTETAVHSGIESNVAVKQFCRDGYGNLFNVEMRTRLIVQGASSSLTNINFPVIVWSSGSNAVNDLGFGDDVVIPNDE